MEAKEISGGSLMQPDYKKGASALGGDIGAEEETGLWAILKTLGFLCVLGWEAVVGQIKRE